LLLFVCCLHTEVKTISSARILKKKSSRNKQQNKRTLNVNECKEAKPSKRGKRRSRLLHRRRRFRINHNNFNIYSMDRKKESESEKKNTKSREKEERIKTHHLKKSAPAMKFMLIIPL
jgi:hypothetical protein